jgi:hypothetical protein
LALACFAWKFNVASVPFNQKFFQRGIYFQLHHLSVLLNCCVGFFHLVRVELIDVGPNYNQQLKIDRECYAEMVVN